MEDKEKKQDNPFARFSLWFIGIIITGIVAAVCNYYVPMFLGGNPTTDTGIHAISPPESSTVSATEEKSISAHVEDDEEVRGVSANEDENTAGSYHYLDQGNQKYYEGDYKGAIDDFNEAIQLNPNYALAFLYRGDAWGALNEYQKAIDDYTEAIRLYPDFADAFHNRGCAWNELGEYQKAIDDFNEAIRLNPDLTDAFSSRAFAWNHLGEYQKAINDCNEAIRLNPEFAIAFNNRGFAWNELGEYEKAIDDCNEAIRLDPNEKMYYQNRSLVYLAIGETDLAKRDKETADSLPE